MSGWQIKSQWVLYIGVTLIFLLAPSILIALYSFGSGRYFQLVPNGFSLRWYIEFAGNARFRTGLMNTLILTVVTTPLCLALCLPTAHAIARRTFPGAALLDAIFTSTLIVPAVVTAIAFLTFFNALGFGNGWGMMRMVVVMTIFCLPLGLRALVANYHGIDPKMEDAARDLGAGSWLIYRRVTLPQLRPGLLAGGIFIFVETVDNFTISVFLSDQYSDTLPIVTFQHMRNYDDPLVAVIATMFSALALVLFMGLSKLVGLDRLLSRG